jgi:hypothetical protein
MFGLRIDAGELVICLVPKTDPLFGSEESKRYFGNMARSNEYLCAVVCLLYSAQDIHAARPTSSSTSFISLFIAVIHLYYHYQALHQMGSKSNGAPVEEMGKEWTEQIINSMGPKTDPRMREVMSSLTRHLHDFAREVDLTFDEWVKGVESKQPALRRPAKLGFSSSQFKLWIRLGLC